MKPNDLLMIPGPTPLPDAVREVMSRPAIGHRSPEFKAILKRVFPRLQWLFQTSSEVLMFTASGTAAMEAAMMNTLNVGDRMLALTCGVFSDRWATVGEKLGFQVDRLAVEPGDHNTVEQLREYLMSDKGKGIKAVTLNHSETSTGVLNPVKELVAVIREHGALSIVDAVTSLGTVELPMDEWGIDMVASGSQKGFMIPPGLSFLAVGPRAWEAHEKCERPGFYFNFKQYRKAQADFTTPYTPATHMIMALDVTLAMMEEETLPGLIARHGKLKRMTRAGLEAMGLELLVKDDQYASAAVTSAYPPEGMAVADVRGGLKKRFGITVANGQKQLMDKIFRVGHLGHVDEREVYTVLAALEHVLIDSGKAKAPAGSAVAAAMDVARGKEQVAV